MKFLLEKYFGLPLWQLLLTVFVIAALSGMAIRTTPLEQSTSVGLEELVEAVVPADGLATSVVWGGLGEQLIEAGVIDPQQFEDIYAQSGGLDETGLRLLYGDTPTGLVVDNSNAHVLLNLFWALGLANENAILSQGPMMDPQYGGYGGFASTGGWALARGHLDNHYNRHQLIFLTPEQQMLVEEVSQNIYRPCCNNPTYFPDCNHGMAMLGLLELMAAQGVDEEQMYTTALQFNSYWFPDTYLTIARYFEQKGTSWSDIDAKEVLGPEYSSATGFNQILASVEPLTASGGGFCGL